MYDDLARSQRPTVLEWAFLHVFLPSVVLTGVMKLAQPMCRCAPVFEVSERISYEVLPIVTPGAGDVAIGAPVVLSIRLPQYPADLRLTATDGRVVLRGLLNDRGRIRRSSIEVLQSTDSRFDETARRAFASGLFWPAAWEGQETWVTMVFEFNLDPVRGTYHAID